MSRNKTSQVNVDPTAEDESDPTEDMVAGDPAYSEDGDYGFVWSDREDRWIRKAEGKSLFES